MATISRIFRTCEPSSCCDDAWEEAYLRFETPAQEKNKFRSRLRRLGADRWPRNSQVVEVFCGRCNGLEALAELGFTSLEGVDLSERLLLQYQGAATLYIADCRTLPFPDKSRDIVIVQGGLHHLPHLPSDLEADLREIQTILRPGGRMVIVEPWLMPLLRVIHFCSRRKLAQRVSRKIEALGTASLAGLILLMYSVWEWYSVHFVALDYARTLRIVIPGVTLVALGFQTILSAFFLSLLAIARR